VVPKPRDGQSEMQYFCESQTFPNSSLPQFHKKKKKKKEKKRKENF
jgi:hypothetical protein